MRIQAKQSQLPGTGCLIDEIVRHAVGDDAHGSIHRPDDGRHARSEAVHDRTLLDHQNVAMIGHDLRQHSLIVWLQVAAVHHCHADTACIENVGSCQRGKHHGADREDRNRLVRISAGATAAAKNFPGRVRNLIYLGSRWHDIRRRVARIAQAERPFVIGKAAAEKTDHFFPVLRRGNDHSRNGQHVGDVVEAHVGRAILTDETGAIHGKDDG